MIGKSLPLKQVQAAIQHASAGSEINAYAMPDKDPLKVQVQEICKEALLDQELE